MAEVLIIGGGFAGLYAAVELSKGNVNITLVEASDYLGGRVKQIHPFRGCPLVDVGGEFIHGDKTHALKLAKKHGWQYEQLEEDPSAGLICKVNSPNAYTYANGHLCCIDDSNTDACHLQELINNFIETGTALRRKFTSTTESNTKFNSSINDKEPLDTEAETELRRHDCSLADFLSQHGVYTNNKVALLSDAYYCQSEGNDINRIGMLEFSRADEAWQCGTYLFRLKKTYQIFLDHLIEKCKNVNIKLNWQAKLVDWHGSDSIKVENQSKDIICAKYVIITVPLKILQDGDIQFTPVLPAWKERVLSMMEMRSACKLFCAFNQSFWPENFNIVYCAEEGWPFKQIWNELAYENNDGERFHVLCGFATASLASQASKIDRTELKNRFLKQLDAVFSTENNKQPASESFVDFYFFDWQAHPFIRGGYASPIVGSHAMSAQLAKSVDRKLFFAGEATNPTAMSTVQAAIDSGIRAANEDHFGHYIFLPFCNWFEDTFKISEIPGVTPNLITLIHFICAIIAGKMVADNSLTWRKAGAVLFEIRSCLDILDGVVFRAQSHNPRFISNHGTLGWYLDSGADVAGSLFVALGTFVYFNHNPPLKDSHHYRNGDKFMRDEESAMKLLPGGGGGRKSDDEDVMFKKRERFSSRAINITIALYALQVFMRSGLWDHFLNAYGDLLEKPLPGVSRKLQAEVLEYHSTRLSLWSWKIFSADAFMHFTVVCVFFNGLWGWMRFFVFFGPPLLAVHCMMCQLQVIQIRSWLGV
eukprot:gene20098-22068_t